MQIKRERCRFILISLLSIFLPFNHLHAYTQRDINHSMSYYRRISERQNLSANDRLAILLRIRDKYKDHRLDFSALEREIAIQENARSKEVSRAMPLQDAARDNKRHVRDMKVEETREFFNIRIVADKPSSHHSFVLRDPDPQVPPKVVLDLHGVTEKLDASKEEKKLDSSTIDKIRLGQFKEEPSAVVRAVIFLRAPAQHMIRETSEGFVISVKKNAADVRNFKPSVHRPPLSKPQLTVSTPTAVTPPPPPTPPQQIAPLPRRITHKIEPQDVLGINIHPAEELSREVVVQPAGEISMPLIGVVNAEGESPEELAETLRVLYSRYVSNPEVSVVVKQYAHRQIFIMGEVRNVGGFQYRNDFRLTELISQAGGFTDRANRRRIKIHRGKGALRTTLTANVEEIIRQGDFTKDILLEPADIVEVPVGALRIAILGDVRNPGNYDYREGLKLIEAISLAGGFTETARASAATILRREGTASRTIRVNVDEILRGRREDVPLMPDDTIYFPRRTISSATWWLQNIMPWLSLISLVLVIQAGI